MKFIVVVLVAIFFSEYLTMPFISSDNIDLLKCTSLYSCHIDKGKQEMPHFPGKKEYTVS